MNLCVSQLHMDLPASLPSRDPNCRIRGLVPVLIGIPFVLDLAKPDLY